MQTDGEEVRWGQGQIPRPNGAGWRAAARRLERQLMGRLRATTDSAVTLLRRLGGGAPPPPPPTPPAARWSWERIEAMLRITVLRRLTCNTRTALAAVGHAGPPTRAMPRRGSNPSVRSRRCAEPLAVEPCGGQLGQAGPRLLTLLTGRRRRPSGGAVR